MLVKNMIVTATPRLARYLRHIHANSAIIPLHEWFDQLWQLYLQQSEEPCQRISEWQSRLLWQRIIMQSIKKNDLELLRPNAVVNEAQQAWNLLYQWQIPLEELKTYDFNQETDSALFAKWAQEYKDYCLRQHWVDDSLLPLFLQKELKKLPNIIVSLWGFDYLTPQLNSFFEYLRNLGANIKQSFTTPQREAQKQYFIYKNEDNEIRAILKQAKAELQQPSSEKIMGIIIPDLSKRWSQVKRICDEELDAETFNIAGGLALVEYPMIADTLILLRWLNQSLPYVEVSHLLRSVFWQGQQGELTSRAKLTLSLAETNYLNVSINALINFIKLRGIEDCKELLNLLDSLAMIQQSWRNKTTSNVWCSRLHELFVKMNWPNGRVLDSKEYQIWQRWLELINELATLDTIIEKPYGGAALVNLLKQQARKIIFQPESKAASLQILGINETVGMEFSYLWITGMTANAWPPEPKSNPFIPVGIQKKYRVMHASFSTEYEFALRCMEQWECADRLTISFPQQSGDIINEPSSVYLLSQDSWVSDNQSEPTIPCCSHIDEINNTDTMNEDVLGLPATKLTGGIQLLQDQAECPFRAYANYRLGARQHKLTSPLTLGASLMRGIVIHQVLHLLWKEFATQQNLLRLSDNDLSIIVKDKVAVTLHQTYSNQLKLNVIPLLFVEVEQERIEKIIMDWINKEKQRDEFKIHALEQSVVVILADMEMDLRIDRIDVLANGEYLIIDYKISSQSSLSWTQERLIQPQLPLYALSHSKPLAGVVFAQVSGTKAGFNGLVKDPQIQLPQASRRSLTTTSFAEQLTKWRKQLELLAEEYQKGYAAVNPFPGQEVCRYCDLQLLCRVDQKG